MPNQQSMEAGPRKSFRESSREDPNANQGQPANLTKEDLNLINEFFYGVRIFPGQDPNLVYVGWVTTQYHIHSKDFTQDMVRVATIQHLDSYGRIQQRYLKCFVLKFISNYL